MRKTLALVAALLAIFGVSASSTSAVTGNFEEDFVHTYVGLVVFYDEDGEFLWRCSGTLLSPHIFLTAGHCTSGATSARVYFRQDAGEEFDPVTGIDSDTGYPETCITNDPGRVDDVCVTSDTLHTYPGFDDFRNFPNTGDVGIVVLDEAVTTLGFAQLATAGSLDVLATSRGRQDVTFTVSGYGVSRINPVQFESFRERLMATAKLVNLRSALADGFNLQTSANPGGGRGGTCFGDSGGPVFYDATTTIVGVTSFGLNANCRGVDFSFRTDQADVLAWILSIAATVGEADDISIVPLS
jgi:hypothetical protein